MTANLTSTTPAGLEPRFLEPEGWRWHVFTNTAGKKIRFGSAFPKSRTPDAVVVCLPGLGEFCEKYFELARAITDSNMAFWVLDWQGQGRSDRPLPNREKRHSFGFEKDVADLHTLILEYVFHSSVASDIGRLPMVMLAHSMGGNIGLRYLIDHPGTFCCAAFTGPMTGIAATRFLSLPVAKAISGLLNLAFGTCYVAGEKNWSPDERDDPARNVYSSDPVRNAVHNAWCKADPLLRVGGVTYGWVYQALKSSKKIQDSLCRWPIEIPCLFALNGREKLVSNAQTRKIAAMLPHAKILDLPDSLHETLMERDQTRATFMKTFFTFLADNKVYQKVKPF